MLYRMSTLSSPQCQIFTAIELLCMPSSAISVVVHSYKCMSVFINVEYTIERLPLEVLSGITTGSMQT